VSSDVGFCDVASVVLCPVSSDVGFCDVASVVLCPVMLGPVMLRQ
jgi:hypothetical protein